MNKPKAVFEVDGFFIWKSDSNKTRFYIKSLDNKGSIVLLSAETHVEYPEYTVSQLLHLMSQNLVDYFPPLDAQKLIEQCSHFPILVQYDNEDYEVITKPNLVPWDRRFSVIQFNIKIR